MEQKANRSELDGQWVAVHHVLANGVTIKTGTRYDMDLSTILPNDDNIYECIFMAEASCAANKSIFTYWKTDFFTNESHFFCARSYNSSTPAAGRATYMSIVGKGRSLYIRSTENSTADSNVLLALLAYRKVR
jgi:hypothetical protein